MGLSFSKPTVVSYFSSDYPAIVCLHLALPGTQEARKCLYVNAAEQCTYREVFSALHLRYEAQRRPSINPHTLAIETVESL